MCTEQLVEHLVLVQFFSQSWALHFKGLMPDINLYHVSPIRLFFMVLRCSGFFVPGSNLNVDPTSRQNHGPNPPKRAHKFVVLRTVADLADSRYAEAVVELHQRLANRSFSHRSLAGVEVPKRTYVHGPTHLKDSPKGYYITCCWGPGKLLLPGPWMSFPLWVLSFLFVLHSS